MSLYRKAKRLIHTYGIIPKKHLGQNFVVDEGFLQHLVSYGALERSDVVLEIGAGFGFLTRLLAEKSRKVVAVEVDARFAPILQSRLADYENIELIEGDIFKAAVPPFNKVISNPPFSISSPLLLWLLKKTFDLAVLTFQREFTERLDADIGTEKYSRLTVLTYYYAEVEVLDDVPRKAFYPPPEVDAAMVKLKRRRLPPFKVRDQKAFSEAVQILFTQRNRKVRNAVLPILRKYGLKGTAAKKRADSLPFHNRRVRRLAPEDFGALANELSA